MHIDRGEACTIKCRGHLNLAIDTLFPQYLELRFGIPARWTFAGLRRFHGGAERTMYNTPSMREMLESHGFTNLVQWIRGVDTELFRPIAPAELDLPRPIQIYVGRIAVEKSIEDFLQADTPGSKVLVGDGPQREELEEKYPELSSPDSPSLTGSYR